MRFDSRGYAIRFARIARIARICDSITIREDCEDMQAISVLEEMHSDDDNVKYAQTERIGRVSIGTKKARPIRITFHTMFSKHAYAFLAYAKDLRQAGISPRVDDDLTRLQQQQRQDLDGDFKILKAKGCKPFFRGSQLKCHVNNELRLCSKGQASKFFTAT